MVKVAHECGYILFDVAPDNIIWDVENRKVYMADLEYVYRKGGLPMADIGTPGFYPLHSKAKVGYKRDLYALGVLLYVLSCPEWYRNLIHSQPDVKQYWHRPPLPECIPTNMREVVEAAILENGFRNIHDMIKTFARVKQSFGRDQHA